MAPFVELTATSAGPEGAREHFEKRGGLRGVPRARSRGVRVDVPHPRGFEPRVRQRRAHRRRGARAVRGGLRHVKARRRLVRILESRRRRERLSRARTPATRAPTPPRPRPSRTRPARRRKDGNIPRDRPGRCPWRLDRRGLSLSRAPATEVASTHPSVPPASITSASPRWTSRNASPMACAPVAHAVAAAWLGPRRRVRHAHLACGHVGEIRGTKKGDKRRSAPRSRRRPALVTSRDVAHARADGDAPARALGVGGVGGDVLALASASDAAASAKLARAGAIFERASNDARRRGARGRGGAREEDVAEVVALRAPSREVAAWASTPRGTPRGDADGELLEPGEALGERPRGGVVGCRTRPQRPGPWRPRATPRGVTRPRPVITTRRCFGRGGWRPPLERGRGRGRGGDAAGRARAPGRMRRR